MNRRLIPGFLYAAAMPVGIAYLAAVIFDGTLIAIPSFSVLLLIVFVLVSLVATFVLGLPVYFSYRRFRITSFSAYLLAGLCLSLAITGFLLWQEYSEAYENISQALLSHTTQIVCLISGPAAAAVFWRYVRPDQVDGARRPARSVAEVRIYWGTGILLGLLLAVLIGFRATEPPAVQSRRPLAEQERGFDSTKSRDLIASLKTYASTHNAHLSYYYMNVHSRPRGGPLTRPILMMATLDFAGGIEIVVSNPKIVTSDSGNKLSAHIYPGGQGTEEHTNLVWSDFVPFLDSAVDHANALPETELPDIPSRGEGGKQEHHWWDWRFHRQEWSQ